MATDPKVVVEAAAAMERLSEESLTAVAQHLGLSMPEMHARIVGKMAELGLVQGDVDALRWLAERTECVVLGRVERCRTPKAKLRRIWREVGSGRMSASTAQKLASLIRVDRELLHDDLDQRLAEVEGSLVERVDG